VLAQGFECSISDVARLAHTSRTRIYGDTEPQYAGHLDRPDVEGIGPTRCTGEAAIQERRLSETFFRRRAPLPERF